MNRDHGANQRDADPEGRQLRGIRYIRNRMTHHTDITAILIQAHGGGFSKAFSRGFDVSVFKWPPHSSLPPPPAKFPDPSEGPHVGIAGASIGLDCGGMAGYHRLAGRRKATGTG